MIKPNELKSLRKLAVKLQRHQLETLVKLGAPHRKPWLSDLPTLRDSVAIMAYINPEVEKELFEMVDGFK